MMNNANPDLMTRLPDVPRIGNNFEAGVAHHLRKLFSLDDELMSSVEMETARVHFHGRGPFL
jgi:hypothetical protein